MSFESAESYCKGKKMQLVKIKDKETDELVYDLAKRHNFGNYWINGNDKESEGVFVDSDKKRLTYFNWHRKQPDNYANLEHCIDVVTDKNGFWNDLPCDTLLNVICEPMETTNSAIEYDFAPGLMSFEAGESYCQGKQMQLVKIDSAEKNKLVFDLSKKHNFGNYWINGNDRETVGVFVTTDKKRLTYTNFKKNLPDNSGGVEHCIHVIGAENGLWNDFACSRQLNVICEPLEPTSYHFATKKMSFESAESYCKGKKMQLVKIKDKETDELVYDWAKRHNFGNYWINGNDKESEGVFVDSDKKRLTYFNWHRKQPDNYANLEHCIHVITDKNGFWNDLPCGTLLNVICEPMEILDFIGSLAKTLCDLCKSIREKFKEYFS